MSDTIPAGLTPEQVQARCTEMRALVAHVLALVPADDKSLDAVTVRATVGVVADVLDYVGGATESYPGFVSGASRVASPPPPDSAQPPSPAQWHDVPSNDDLGARMRELEERLALVEGKHAATSSALMARVDASQQAAQARWPSCASPGLYGKFCVERVDGRSAPGEKHHECRYFVVDETHDELAPLVLRTYARACARSKPNLSTDLMIRAAELAHHRGLCGQCLLAPSGDHEYGRCDGCHEAHHGAHWNALYESAWEGIFATSTREQRAQAMTALEHLIAIGRRLDPAPPRDAAIAGSALPSAVRRLDFAIEETWSDEYPYVLRLNGHPIQRYLVRGLANAMRERLLAALDIQDPSTLRGENVHVMIDAPRIEVRAHPADATFGVVTINGRDVDTYGGREIAENHARAIRDALGVAEAPKVDSGSLESEP